MLGGGGGEHFEFTDHNDAQNPGLLRGMNRGEATGWSTAVDGQVKKITDKINRCVQLLEDHRKSLLDSVTKSGQDKEPPALMILRGFKFAIAGMRAVLDMVDDRDKAIFAACVIRPVYEVAVRILWAAPQQYGYHIVRNDCARQALTLIRENEGDPQLAEMVQRMKQRLQSLLKEKTATGDEIPSKLPAMPQILEQIATHDKQTRSAESRGMWRGQYGAIYKTLCGPSHADVLDLGADYARHWPLVETASVLATYTLLRVFLIVTIPDPAKLRAAIGDLESMMDELFEP